MQTDNIITLTAPEGCILHRIGTDSYAPIRRVAVPESRSDEWETIAEADIPAVSPADYAAEVERRIRERYTTAQELAILRQRDTKPQEFADYFAYAEQCKQQARGGEVIESN